jgi:hypothetical protein
MWGSYEEVILLDRQQINRFITEQSYLSGCTLATFPSQIVI